MKTEDLIDIARHRMDAARDVEDIHIDRGVSDLKFLSGEYQWDEEDRRRREAEGKPTLTFNALPQYVRKITGQIRQLNPGVKVSAGNDAASEEVAEIYEGLIREAEYRCDAASIYEGCAESGAQCGIGNFRIRADYCDYESFDQHLVIERIWNPFAVFYDPSSKAPTREDAEYVFILEEMHKDRFKAAYPDAKLTDFDSSSVPEWLHRWRSGDSVIVAEYFWKDYEEYEIAQTPEGQIIRGPFPKGMQLRKRKVRKPVIMWAKLTGDEVLEGPQRVAGSYIPVVAVTGEEIHIGEETYRSGAIRFAKDAQIAYNVMRTASVETALLQPRAPYLVTAKQVAGLETYWAEANSANRPYLPYNVDDKAPPPMRVPPPVAPAALVAEAQIAAEDMKRTTGIYDASLGARSNETSGVAIQSRQREADMATSIYSDNMVKAVAHAGRIMVSMIREVYDTERVIRILGEDAQEKIVAINKIVESMDGYEVQNDMTAGEYAVRVSVGPTWANRKQEAGAGMMDFLQRIPQAAPIIADLVAGSQEWPDADRIAERLKKTIPPQLLEDDEKDDQQPDPAKQAQMQQAQQQAQLEGAKAQADVRKAIAEAAEAAAQARKAQADAEKAIIELQALKGVAMTGQPVEPSAVPMQPGQAPSF